MTSHLSAAEILLPYGACPVSTFPSHAHKVDHPGGTAMESEAGGMSWPKEMLLPCPWLQPMAAEEAGAVGWELWDIRDSRRDFQGKSWSVPLRMLWETMVLVSMK